MTQIAFISALFSSRDGITAGLNLRCHNEPSMEISIVHDSVYGYRTYELKGQDTLIAIEVRDCECLAVAARIDSRTVASGVLEVDFSLMDWGAILAPRSISNIILDQNDGCLVDHGAASLDDLIGTEEQLATVEVSRC